MTAFDNGLIVTPGGAAAALLGDAEMWIYADYATAIAAGDTWGDGDD